MTASVASDVGTKASNQSGVSANWEVEVFYDGECPLCVREIKMLRRMDRKNRIIFTDIATPSFEAEAVGKDMDTLMAEIHARLPNGKLIAGVEVFRRLYAAVGLSSLVSLTRLPVISHGLEFGYRIFARNRLRFTGRCKAEVCSTS